jgi:hypothetical protein
VYLVSDQTTRGFFALLQTNEFERWNREGTLYATCVLAVDLVEKQLFEPKGNLSC